MHCPDAVYHLRYSQAGKRIWQPVGTDATLAQVALQKKSLELQASALGVRLQPETEAQQAEVTKPSSPVSDQEPRSLIRCMEEYLRETAEHKSDKTFVAYSETLSLFLKSLSLSSQADKKPRTSKAAPKKKLSKEERLISALFLDQPLELAAAVREMCIEGISRQSVMQYVSYLRGLGNQPRTIRNRVDYLQIFLHHFGLPSVLKGKDLPRYTDKKVRAYNAREINLMFEHATEDEADLLHRTHSGSTVIST